MKIKRFTYYLFYSAAIAAVLAVIFANSALVYFKPPVILSLSFLYVVNAEKKNYLVLFSLLLILTCEILFLQDYLGNFVMLHILLSTYYCLNIMLLWKSLQVVKVRLKKVFTLQLIISMALVTYILFSVAELILPRVTGHLNVLVMLIFSFALFIGVCYYIYLNSRTVISYSLMIAASSFLIVNIVTSLNRLYISLEIFPVITTTLQMVGQFFLIKFFIDQHKLMPNKEDYF